MLGPDTNTTKGGIAQCPEGELALGGGWVQSGGVGMFVITNAPAGDPPTGWEFLGYASNTLPNLSGSSITVAAPIWSVTVYAICANATSGGSTTSFQSDGLSAAIPVALPHRTNQLLTQ